jgi:DNA repair photolyase
MGLNKSKGNMYDFITHTWNTIKGECPHGCSYCYCKRWGEQKPVRFDEKELKTDLGQGNFIFVGSSCDMFANDIPKEWITETLIKADFYTGNKYLFQSKNPERFIEFGEYLPDGHRTYLCTTIETNRWYSGIMGNCPSIGERIQALRRIKNVIPIYITIEPIMDFDLDVLVKMIRLVKPKQVNIGADSGNNNLPEPSKEKVLELISELEKFTIVKQKTNLKRLLS